MFELFKTIGIGILIMTAVSCTNSVDYENKSEEVSHEGTNDLTLKLNDGERWKANAATTEGINKMMVIVDEFSEADSVDAYLQLKTDLEAEFASIFKQCTMTGPAHDQLHNYLFPLKRLFNRLKSEDSAERIKAVAELKDYLQEYFVYFR